MTEQLVIRLGSDDNAAVHWLVWSSQEQEIIASGELSRADELSSLTERVSSRRLIALIPGSACQTVWLNLPAKAARKAQQAIPFMLEDDLVGDISEHFFALGSRAGDQQAVAVVKRSRLQAWLDKINDAGFTCDKMLPDTLALPHESGRWSMLKLGEELLVRQDSWLSIQGSTLWLQDAIEFHAKHQPEPVAINNYSDLDLNHLANITVEQQPLELPMQVLAKGAISASFNLLQGEFKVKRNTNTHWHKWRIAAALAVIALTASVADKAITLHQLQSEKAALNEQIRAEFKRAFPETVRIVNVRSQMRQKMAALEQGGVSASVLAVLSQLSDAFAQSQVKPQTIRFDSKRSELRMQAVAANFEALEQFRRLAEQQGFEVQPGAINNRDNQVVGSIAIRS